ncbi:ABC transporter permease [Pseudoxanthomonas wuyuanensis]
MDFRFPFLLLCRHHGTAALLVTQMAIGFVLLSLAWQAGVRYHAAVTTSSGIADAELLAIKPLGKGAGPIDPEEVLAGLRSLPGVQQAASSNQIPYGTDSWNTKLSQHQHTHHGAVATVYFGSETLYETLDLQLTEGRRFRPAEQRTFGDAPPRVAGDPPPAIVTDALANRLFPDGSAIGRELHGWPGTPPRIVGIVDRLPQPAGSRALADDRVALMLPLKPSDASWAFFLVRAAPGQRTEVATRAHAYLAAAFPDRAIALPVALDALRHSYFRNERQRAWILAASAAGWWLLTLLSIAAAGNLWVQRSVLRISLHRAVGATRRQVMRAVWLENLLLAGAGSTLGGVLASFVFDRLPAPWALAPAPLGWRIAAALSILLAAQLAATWPAYRAGNVPPCRVTRKPWVRL